MHVGRSLVVGLFRLLVGVQTGHGLLAALHLLHRAQNVVLGVAVDQILHAGHKGAKGPVGHQGQQAGNVDVKADKGLLLVVDLFLPIDQADGHQSGVGLALVEALEGGQLHRLHLGDLIG